MHICIHIHTYTQTNTLALSQTWSWAHQYLELQTVLSYSHLHCQEDRRISLKTKIRSKYFPHVKATNTLTCYANTQEHTQGHRGMRIQVWLLTPGGVRILLNDIEDKVKFHKLLRVGHYGYPGTLRNSVTANHTSPAIFFLLPPNLPSHHKSPPHLPCLKNLSHNL